MTRWSVRYYRDSQGRIPVADFFVVPSPHGITKEEGIKFLTRLNHVRQEGLALLASNPEVLASLTGHDNLYSLRL